MSGTRRSDRLKKKQPNYFVEVPTESDDSTEPENSIDVLNNTGKASSSSTMDAEGIKSLIEKLSQQFMSMNARMEEKNAELQDKLEATTRQLVEVQKQIDVSPKFVPSVCQTNYARPPPVSMNVTNLSLGHLPASQMSTTSASVPDVPTMEMPPMMTDAFARAPVTSTTSSANYPKTGIPQAQPTTSGSQDFMPYPYYCHLPARKKLIPLPKFDGRPNDWLSFIADYERTTYEFKYTGAENTSRLKECLTGAANKLVHWMLLQYDAADAIIERLYNRFGRPELLIDAQISMLQAISPISETDMKEVVDFADSVTNFSYFMVKLNSQHHLANPLLLRDLILKLPMKLRMKWTTHIKYMMTVPTIMDFSKWIAEIGDDVARVPVDDNFSLQTEKKVVPKKGRTLHTNSTAKTEIKCVLCHKDHTLSSCTEFLKKTIDDKWTFVRGKRLCFSCLKFGHPTTFCRSKRTCGIDGCTRVHNQLIHSVDNKPTGSTQPTRSEETRQPALLASDPVINCHATSKETEPRLLFKVIPVRLYNAGNMVSTFALIDEGSSVSLITRDLSQRLGLTGPKRRLNLQWLGDHQSSEESEVVKFKISGAHASSEVFEMNNVCSVKNLCLPMQTLDMSQLHSKYSHLRSLPILSYTDAKPELLIGLDFCHLGVPQKKIRHASNGPIVAESSLGWIVYGRTNNEQTNSSQEKILHASERFEELDAVVKDYFTTENFGVQPSVKRIESADISRARQLLQSTTKMVDGRYESGLLWKNDNLTLPDSYQMAVNRLMSVENKMKKDSTYASKYKETIASYVEKGYAHKLLQEEASKVTPRTWYLPHFGVINPNKPGKFRMVFDAAAKVGETSLNSSLLTGPDLNQNLLTVLSKFREGRVGVCGDIKEMFHQVLIRQEDQASQRFLWRNEETGEIDVYKMQAMTFGSTSSPTTAQYVKNFHANQYLNTHPEAAKAIVERHYVDDYVISFNNEDEAIAVSLDVKEIERVGGFDLRGFVSNSRRVASVLNNDLSDKVGQVDMNMDKNNTCDKILGMIWDTSTDDFKFNLKFNRIESAVLSCKKIPTKREFLAVVMSVYDPFGFLADFLVYMKVLLQLVWRSGIDWDQQIPTHLHERWCSWSLELQKVRQFTIPRCYSGELWTSKCIEIHTFVDASEVAFSAVCYLRITSQTGNVSVSFVIGKTKCAPVKYLSIPRLELQAAVLGVRLQKTVLKSHNFEVSKSTFWSDSKTVLHWIKSDSRKYKSFVANRIGEILDSTKPSQWNWVSTKENAADDATRDSYPPDFKLNRRWIYGPQWLKSNESDWPHQPECQAVDDNDLELQPMKQHTFLISENPIKFNFTDSSSYFKILRAAGWIIRFVFNFKAKMFDTVMNKGELKFQEIRQAEILLFRSVQMEAFNEEYQLLKQGMPISKRSEIYQLTPSLSEDRLIRVYGRIDFAPTLPLKSKHPIILPKCHALTNLVVEHYHRLFKHQNEDTIICEIRRKFWINDLRTLVRSSKRRCQECKNDSAQPETPQMGQLPVDRLTPFIRPFTYTGLDYFGPINVTIGRRQEKRWVALFTCLTIRAVHLELAENLSTDACIICIRNFINLRGIPFRIRSDNGSNFVGVKGELMTVENLYNKNSIIFGEHHERN